MDRDFLNGIDEQFNRLMTSQGKGGSKAARSKSSSGERKEDRLVGQIADILEGLTVPQREEVLAFVQGLRQKSGPG